MEVKKTPKADLENKKAIFLQIGLMLALALTWVAFEWKVDTAKAEVMETVAEATADEEMTPITTQQAPPPPPPPPAPRASDVLTIVDSDEDFDDELEIEDVEADTEAEVEIQDVEEEEEEGEGQIFMRVEQMPEFPGGMKALFKFLSRNTKYPTIALENGVQGRVIVGFVVGKKGQITEVKVLRPVDSYLDKEAVRVVKSMPNWIPGKQMNKAVRVSYNVPVNFKLK